MPSPDVTGTLGDSILLSHPLAETSARPGVSSAPLASAPSKAGRPGSPLPLHSASFSPALPDPLPSGKPAGGPLWSVLPSSLPCGWGGPVVAQWGWEAAGPGQHPEGSGCPGMHVPPSSYTPGLAPDGLSGVRVHKCPW